MREFQEQTLKKYKAFQTVDTILELLSAMSLMMKQIEDLQRKACPYKEKCHEKSDKQESKETSATVQSGLDDDPKE